MPGCLTITEMIYGDGSRRRMSSSCFRAARLARAYVKAVKGPLPQINLMPTGGVSIGQRQGLDRCRRRRRRRRIGTHRTGEARAIMPKSTANSQNSSSPPCGLARGIRNMIVDSISRPSTVSTRRSIPPCAWIVDVSAKQRRFKTVPVGRHHSDSMAVDLIREDYSSKPAEPVPIRIAMKNTPILQMGLDRNGSHRRYADQKPNGLMSDHDSVFAGTKTSRNKTSETATIITLQPNHVRAGFSCTNCTSTENPNEHTPK
ncbi:MAG: hypothetical protein MZU97_26400 [Bacillus subtilis]|nr:hypothetical protein [Bacillus subtilis]